MFSTWFYLKKKDITVPSFSTCINNQGQALFICLPGYAKSDQDSICTRKKFDFIDLISIRFFNLNFKFSKSG